MNSEKLKELLVDHKNKALKPQKFFSRTAIRDCKDILSKKEIHVITGVRRSGKSTLMRLLMQHLVEIQGVSPRQIMYLNFEDERFVGFKSDDFQTLYETYLSMEEPKGKTYFFLDEIQNIEHWEKWVNRLYEFSDIKIFITGSNATMLAGDIASRLTGRNRVRELYPFSFNEFIGAKGTRVDKKSLFLPEIKASIIAHFNRYMETGGFPEPIKTNDTSILQDYYRDIIYRDIAARYKVKHIQELKELALFLASNQGCVISLKKIKDTISINSLATVKKYLEFLEQAYLFIKLRLFSYSVKRQIYNPPKIYCIDHALAARVGFRFSANTGRMLENIVCIELKRRGGEIYYWRDKAGAEVDFLVRRETDIVAIIQVCHVLETINTRQREIRGILAAAAEFDLNRATIITSDEWGTEIIGDVKIDIVPIWKWLMEDDTVKTEE